MRGSPGSLSSTASGSRLIVRKSGAGRGLHPQTLDWLDALGDPRPDPVFVHATNYWNWEMDILGILSNYKMVNLFVGNNKAQAMVCNIATMGNRTLTEANGTGLTYGATFGFEADGQTIFRTGVIPENVGVVGGMSTWMQIEVTGTLWHDAAGARPLTDNETYLINLHPSGPDWAGFWGDNNAFQVFEALAPGLYTVRRSSNTNLKGFKDGVEKGSSTTLTTPNTPLGDLAIFGRNRQGLTSAQLPSPNKIGGFAIEDGMIPDAKRLEEAAVWANTMSILGRE